MSTIPAGTRDVRSENQKQQKEHVAKISLGFALILTILKVVVCLATNSLAVLSETLHSGLDLLATGMTWLAIRFANKPPDSNHPYGHARIENLSAIAESLLLYLACFYIVEESVNRLISETDMVTPNLWAILVMLFCLFIDCNRVRVLKKTVKETQSQALEADAMHFSTDILASVAALVGLGLVFLGSVLQFSPFWQNLLTKADTFAAFIVAIIIFVVSSKMIYKAAQVLLDNCSPDLCNNLRALVMKVPGVENIRKLRLRQSGSTYYVDLVISISGSISVAQGHDICQKIEDMLQAQLGDCDITIHTDPVQ